MTQVQVAQLIFGSIIAFVGGAAVYLISRYERKSCDAGLFGRAVSFSKWPCIAIAGFGVYEVLRAFGVVSSLNAFFQ